MSAEEGKRKVEAKEKEEKGGELLFCGATAWDMIGRNRDNLEGNLVSPTRIRSLVGVDIRFVASGCSSCHCVALDVEGRCYTWGRNEKGQLGHGDTIWRDQPTIVSELKKYKIVNAGAGRSHTVVVTDEGQSLAFGWNKHGQLGLGSTKKEIETVPIRCQVTEVNTTACGAEFTVWLSSVEGASILTAGLPQYGQLGHGTHNEYNMKEGSVKLAYEAQPWPKAIAALAEETIVKVACGINHTVAVDSKGYVYTWGFGGYGRLGHREQKDEWVPRRVDVFQRQNVLPPDAVVSAGSMNSACTAGGGQLYMWGKLKRTSDDAMYPKPLMDLSGWNIRCMDSGSAHHFVGADTSCISWGAALYGELGYGPEGQKSSSVPKKVDILEDMHVIGVACGMAHSMVIVDRANVGDRLDQLDVYDGKPFVEGSEEPEKKATVPKQTKKRGAATKGQTKKTKKEASSSEEEEEEEKEEEEQSEVEEDDSGQKSDHKKLKRGRNAAAAAGRGRGKSTTKAPAGGGKGRGKGSSQPSEAELVRRGRSRRS